MAIEEDDVGLYGEDNGLANFPGERRLTRVTS